MEKGVGVSSSVYRLFFVDFLEIRKFDSTPTNASTFEQQKHHAWNLFHPCICSYFKHIVINILAKFFRVTHDGCPPCFVLIVTSLPVCVWDCGWNRYVRCGWAPPGLQQFAAGARQYGTVQQRQWRTANWKLLRFGYCAPIRVCCLTEMYGSRKVRRTNFRPGKNYWEYYQPVIWSKNVQFWVILSCV